MACRMLILRLWRAAVSNLRIACVAVSNLGVACGAVSNLRVACVDVSDLGIRALYIPLMVSIVLYLLYLSYVR